MLEPIPWFVGYDQTKHSPELARVMARIPFGDSMGILERTDLNVRELAVPGPQVRISPGIGVMPNYYAGGDGQTYIGRNSSQTNLDVPATDSSGGQAYLVILRVDDPQYGGQAPADPGNPDSFVFQRFALVKCGAAATEIANPTYPYVPLARINMPASTATITQSMITDVRELAAPRRLTVMRPVPVVAGDTGLALIQSDADGEWFPNEPGPQDIFIPKWAVRAQIECKWLCVIYEANKNPFGSYWVEYGPYASSQNRERSTQRFGFDCAAAGNSQRVNWILGDDVYIPAEYRGTTQKFVPKATYTGAQNGVSLGTSSGMIMSVTFLEAPDPSTS